MKVIEERTSIAFEHLHELRDDGNGDFFDTIVIGERKDRHWISGSNGFARTNDFPGSFPEQKANERLHLAMVYKEDGTTTLYRNGQPYGRPFRKGSAKFPKNQSSVIFWSQTSSCRRWQVP